MGDRHSSSFIVEKLLHSLNMSFVLLIDLCVCFLSEPIFAAALVAGEERLPIFAAASLAGEERRAPIAPSPLRVSQARGCRMERPVRSVHIHCGDS